MHAYVFMFGSWACTCMCMLWKPKVDIRSLPWPLFMVFIEAESLSWARVPTCPRDSLWLFPMGCHIHLEDTEITDESTLCFSSSQAPCSWLSWCWGSLLVAYVALRPVAELLHLMQSVYSVQENLILFRVKIMQMALAVFSSRTLLDHLVLSECGCHSQQTLALMTLQCLLW